MAKIKILDFLWRKAFLLTPLAETALCPRIQYSLEKAAIMTVGDITKHTSSEIRLMFFRPFKHILEVDDFMARNGLKFKRG